MVWGVALLGRCLHNMGHERNEIEILFFHPLLREFAFGFRGGGVAVRPRLRRRTQRPFLDGGLRSFLRPSFDGRPFFFLQENSRR